MRPTLRVWGRFFLPFLLWLSPSPANQPGPGPPRHAHSPLHHWSKIVDSLKLLVELSVNVLLLILHFEATVLHYTDTL